MRDRKNKTETQKERNKRHKRKIVRKRKKEREKEGTEPHHNKDIYVLEETAAKVKAAVRDFTSASGSQRI